MSLLMDALKKAELAKRQAKGLNEPAVSAAQVMSLSYASETAASRDRTARGIAMIESESAATGPRTGLQQGGSGDPSVEGNRAAEVSADRAAAQSLFTAKRPPSRMPLYIGLLAAVLVALAGIGYYFWLQIRPTTGGIAAGGALNSAPGASPAAQPMLPQSAPLTPAARAPAQATPAPNPAPSAQAGARASQPSLVSASTPYAAGPKPVPAMSRPQPAQSMPSNQPAQGRMSDEAPTAAPEPRLPLRVGSAPQRVNADVAAGYRAFHSGDLAEARRAYEQALRGEPGNRDALHGLAAISMRQGNYEAAETLYIRALEADPKDALAQSALIGLRGQADPVRSESRLKSLIAAQPDAHFLHFNLGNLYAREGRWAEAQQAYFRAHSREPENPDYLFNLAVSLDQVHQPKLAAQFYQSALAAAATRTAGFDRGQAETRLRELLQ